MKFKWKFRYYIISYRQFSMQFNLKFHKKLLRKFLMFYEVSYSYLHFMWLSLHVCCRMQRMISLTLLLAVMKEHYSDVIMGTMVSQITSLTIVYSTIYSDSDQRKHQSSTSLAFVWGIHRWLVNSPHKWPVMQKKFPFDDIIMNLMFVFYRMWFVARCYCSASGSYQIPPIVCIVCYMTADSGNRNK